MTPTSSASPPKRLDEQKALRIVDAYLSTSFEGGRHARRVEKLDHSSAVPAVTGAPLAEVDPQIADAIRREAQRQYDNIELIASENFTSRAVMEAQGSCLTNKYAEGYPGKRWYGGCENVDMVGAARHRPRARALRRGARQRAAALRLARRTWRSISPCSSPATAS